MSMYLGQIHVRASLPVNYGLLYWAFISGLHVINKWKMCSEFQKIKCVPYYLLSCSGVADGEEWETSLVRVRGSTTAVVRRENINWTWHYFYKRPAFYTPQ